MTVIARAQVSVLTQHNDNSRTGQNINETVLTPANVNVTQFRKLFAQPVDGQLYAQPLYVPSVTITGKGTHNVIFVATEADTVYAFDADNNSGNNAAPLWQVSLLDRAHGAAAGATPVSNQDTGCGLLQPTAGITSTPVIDASSGTMYVEAESKENENFIHRLHAIDISTGAERPSSPVSITATVNGTGDGSVSGQLTFDGLTQLSRPGLLLSNGMVYIAYASPCDVAPYHGWLFAYDASNMTQKAVFVSTPNGGLGGIWMSGSGLAADSNGTIFTVTGNGTFDTTNIPATELSDSILKLGMTNGTVSLLDYFTPFDQGDLSDEDNDVGSGGVLLLPDQPGSTPHELVETSKTGVIYLLNRDQLTANNEHYCASNCGGTDPEILQELNGVIGGTWSMPAYWNGTLYTWGAFDVLDAFPLNNGLLGTVSSSSNTTDNQNGVTPSISANGNANGIVWAIVNENNNGTAVLHAFDATDLSVELYNSSQAPNNRDQAGPAVKFTVPSIANGKVYVGTATELDVFGVVPTVSGDYDGDGMTDITVWRPSEGNWYTIPSSNASTQIVTQWGTEGDVPVPGDYDGDGKTDLAVWRPSDGTWYIVPSSNPNSHVSQPWGTNGDIPVPGDYDGDHKTDIAVWRPSDGVWYIVPSTNPASPVTQQWGTDGDVPAPADYDGDGKTDIAVFRPSSGTWYIIPSANSASQIVTQWGTQDDVPVPGDYDGDGKADVAVWRPSNGTWYIIPSSNPANQIATQWGTQGDVPVPGDYDGDGKTDFAVFRPSTGTWYIIPSSNPSSPIQIHWGTATDIALD